MLGQVDAEHIGVLSRMTVMRYKRTTDGVARIGRELGAAYVVEGSLRGEAGRRRVTATLVRTRDQTQVWSASFDSEPRACSSFSASSPASSRSRCACSLDPRRSRRLGLRQLAMSRRSIATCADATCGTG